MVRKKGCSGSHQTVDRDQCFTGKDRHPKAHPAPRAAQPHFIDIIPAPAAVKTQAAQKMIQPDKRQVGIGQKFREITLLPVLGDNRWLNRKLVKHIRGGSGKCIGGKPPNKAIKPPSDAW